MDFWVSIWLVWLGLFLVFELTAVAFRKRTLSAQTWDWFSLRLRKRYWLGRRIVFVVFWVGLGSHFYWQLPAVWSVVLPGIPFAAVIVLSSLYERRDEPAAVSSKESIP